MKNRTTICSKHDEVIGLADEIEELLLSLGETDLVTQLPILSRVQNIRSLTEDAKEDGQSMEAGLDRKRDQIKKLEDRVEELKEQIMELEEDWVYGDE